MRIYKNMAEAIGEIERDIIEMGIHVHPHTMQNKDVKDNPDYDTLEVQNYSFTVLDMHDKDECVGQCLPWCILEFAERVDEDKTFMNPGHAWVAREAVWEEFLNEKRQFDYTYNERINYCNQLFRVIQELKHNPDTRQAIIHVHFPEDSVHMQQKRIPCSMYYQLMVRRGKLDIIYNMRSSDFNTHFKNDMWLADELRRFISMKTQIKPGVFMMNIGSLHVYRNYGNNKIVF